MIYDIRSKSLHGGQPMPYPLLQSPYQGDLKVPEEKPTGNGHAYGNTTWAPKDVPIHLHTFAGLTRRALLGWWTQLAVDRANRQNNERPTD